ncbi:MAG: hypothetical protein ACLTER_27255 [Ruminococcus sp.]
MKTGATLYPCDVKTRDAYANMDVAGYNYGIKRYHHDLKKYPKRIILGSETFCADAYRFMRKQNVISVSLVISSGLLRIIWVRLESAQWEYTGLCTSF